MAARKEILFEGYFYDVTDFIRKHPGGTVIEYYTEKGEDGTIAIRQFHKRSAEKVRLMMNTLEKRPASDGEIGLDPDVLKKNRSLTEDFTKLHLELEREGYFDPSYMQSLVRLMEMLFWAVVGLMLYYNQKHLLGVIALTLARIRTGFMVHELGHNSYTGSPKVDRVLGIILQGMMVGLSVGRWKRLHNRHHAMPQRLHHDVDLETMPLFAYNKKVVRKPSDGKRFHIQYQAYLFAFDCILVALLWMLYQYPKFMFKNRNYLEIFCVASHGVIFYHLGFWPWIVSAWFGSFYMLLTFSMNHTFLPVTAEPTHWVEYAFHHSANLESTPWCDWATGHLNYQIEHHLFPTMPNFRLPFISDRVKKLAQKYNLPYSICSYSDGVYKTFKNMSDVSKEVSA
ncbi:acyl-lipid (8-3)-desaturase-like isoform X3 [Bradysia coprophila]|uniref:acyl-lipid (8-3)-desaturase-like isoform X3 n=1 Tax=Bradysia coprophila TaxID=38358 RepID=UPI00187D81CE|nr:acyl-lipid (8-3)-desaturase-like isoform X3 [Bradysia coprophila]